MRSLAKLGLAVPVAVALAATAASGASAAVPATDGQVPSARVSAHPQRAVHNPLLKDTLAAKDDGGDGSQDLAALCQSFLSRGGSPYRSPAPNVDMISGDGKTRTGSGAGCSTAQNETVVAVNPANPANLVAGTNDYRLFNARENRNDSAGVAYTSMDGGRTWRDIVLPGLTVQTGATGQLAIMDSAGDPAIAFGPDNHVYYANIAFSRLTTASAITVNSSADGGLTWGQPTIVRLDGVNADGTARPTPYFNDKEWIAVDPTSGKVYVTWSRFTSSNGKQADYLGSPIVLSSSGDQGRTFTRQTPVSPGVGQLKNHVTPFGSGSVPQVGRDGTLYVAWEASICKTLACAGTLDHDATVVATSRDGGRSFATAVVGANDDFPVNPDTGSSTLSGEVFRINSFPSLAYDATTDKLYVAWADDRNGTYTRAGQSVRTNGDVVWSTSVGGASWAGLQTVGSGQDEVFPWIAVGGGKAAVSYYTRSYDPWDPSGTAGPASFGVGLDYAMTPLTAAGAGPVRRLTTQTSDPRVQFTQAGIVTHNLLSGVFIGDYTGLAIGSDGVAHPVWTDFRGNPGTTKPNQDAYTQAVPLG